MIRITPAPFDPGAELTGFQNGLAHAGGVVVFTGVVRPDDGVDAVTELYLEHYPGMTERAIAAREDEARIRWGLEDVLIIHRVGTLTPGEPIVLVAAAARHRREAFEAADFLMDYLKTDAAFWKRETTASGARWVEPRRRDHADAARWGRETIKG
ncbi:MAG: molybdenum cofactor biosynthesis protein MoaE [Caulobacterales bacterium]|nr:molybdenum cofactor biosynthesis protein MoaE [Caulobacterales bacterium]